MLSLLYFNLGMLHSREALQRCENLSGKFRSNQVTDGANGRGVTLLQRDIPVTPNASCCWLFLPKECTFPNNRRSREGVVKKLMQNCQRGKKKFWPHEILFKCNPARNLRCWQCHQCLGHQTVRNRCRVRSRVLDNSK